MYYYGIEIYGIEIVALAAVVELNPIGRNIKGSLFRNCAEVFVFTALRVERLYILELKLQFVIIPVISLFSNEYDINVNG